MELNVIEEKIVNFHIPKKMSNKVAYSKNKNKLRNKRNNNVILVWDVKIINVNINIQT